ncbi:beta-L-arabinofuranosidase domain-containing protein [Gaoshiqia sediminis]|uniref:Glycoside hydrolase family 127 protein n=1 Tax=Gaoshiqia sediminis TaxID=2986998 RepID=A0AA41YD93_9BACT|nr:beta-L-arabinofuranosidase domain-containing protein [Gaoshiqia sediminis]MCW0484495.1 glycoside hydrolase family 127 protein [Gaoshiqia sediminis]
MHLKKLLFFAIITTIGYLSACKDSRNDASVTVVDYPVLNKQNDFYLSNRAPLQPAHFIKLPLGNIQPKGWILKLLELQKDGLCGHLGEISAWLEKDNNAWLSEGGDHGWEEVPYWLRGYADMAFIFDDAEMKQEAMIWIEAIINSQKENGWFGPEVRSENGNLDYWSNMIVLFTLQNYYEYSGDQRVIDFMTKYFRYEMTVPDEEFLSSYWENSRGGDNLYSVYWLYNITGDSFLLNLAEKIHRNTANWTRKSTLPNWHNVNIAQCFREPATWFLQSGDSAHLEASYHVHDLIRRTFGQVPGGMFGSDENSRMGYIDPRQGTETCGFAEQMTSDGIMMRITGDPLWADNCEDVLFNSFAAAFTPDMKALRYLTCPNGVTADAENHHPGIDNRGPFLTMNPFSSRCCQHNHGHALPYYLQNLVMASNDNGLAAVLYNSCVTKAKVGNGTEVTLTEETKYPFEENIYFTLNTTENVQFPLYLRVPAWCNKASVTLNGKRLPLEAQPSAYLKLDREWADGDQITLTLSMDLTYRSWQVNQNSVSVDYGPLTFSLRIEEEYNKISSTESAIGDSKWQADADPEKWPAYTIDPKSPWNYGLVLDKNNLAGSLKIERKEWPADDYPFSPENTPIEMQAKGRQIPSWGIDRYGLVDVLPRYPVKTSEPVEDITLIPMGAARLRISAFPFLRE